ncbi:MAG: glycosyltransferase family 39 protein [Lentisphaeria bacterium]|nr:glycosyltransferase family 39 protein [Lentisphaeria bacterium]
MIVALYPRFWAHIHFNFKDVPVTFTYWLTIFTFIYAMKKKCPGWMYLSGIVWGLALLCKANAFFLAFILGPYFIIFLLEQRMNKGDYKIKKPFLISLIAYPFIGLSIMILFWPILMQDFPTNIYKYFNYLLGRGFEGQNSWNIAPILYAVTTIPVVILAFLFAGIGIILYQMKCKKHIAFNSLLLLTLIIPVLRVSIPGARDFDGIRHWLEFIPAVALISTLALHRLISLIAEKMPKANHQIISLSVIFCLCFLPVTFWNIKNHPYQIVHFNALIGGLKGAQEMKLPDATDYWGISYRQGIYWLNKHAEEDSLIVTPIGPLIVFSMSHTDLRDDFKLLPYKNAGPGRDITAEEFEKEIASIDRHIYYMYVTRTDHYNEFTKKIDSQIPVFQVEVDGGIAMKIYKLK